MYPAAIAPVFILPLLAGPALAWETRGQAFNASSAGIKQQTGGIESLPLALSVIGA